MNKKNVQYKKGFSVLIILVLVSSFFVALNSTHNAVASANLCISPNAWTTAYTGMHYGIGGVTNVVLDEVETYLGEPSVRIDPVGTSGNTGREANSYYTRISPGDTISFSVWIKTDESTLGDTDTNSGGRIGIDYYGASGRIGATQSPDGDPSWVPPGTWDDKTYLNYVHWGTETWTQITMEFTVPATFPADPWCAAGYTTGQYYAPSAIIPWLQVYSSTYGTADGGSAYFAASELYINGEEVPLPTDAVFYDGFENGNFNAWNDTDVSSWAGSTLTVNGSSAYSGLYGAKLDGLNAIDTGGYVEKNLVKQNEFYFNAYFRFSSHLNDNTDIGSLLYAATETPWGDYMGVILCRVVGDSSYYWQFYHSYESRTWNSSTFTLQPDTWYNLQLYVLDSTDYANNGAFTVYVDEVEVLSQTNVRMGNVAGWETFRVGASQSVDAGAGMIEFDEITISDSYIEPVVDTYVITNSITSPTNTTYATSTVPYEMFVVAGNDTVAGYQINAYYSNGTAVGANQTASTGSFESLPDGSYKFAVYVLGENGASDYDEVFFSVYTVVTYSASVAINNPANTTYTTSTVPVYFLTSTNGTVTDIKYNIAFSNGTTTSNFTYTGVTSIIVNSNVTGILTAYIETEEGAFDTDTVGFTVTVITGDTPTPTPTPTTTPTATPIIITGDTQDLYFRSDTYDTLNETAYGLDADYTNTLSTSNTRTSIDLIQYGFKVYLFSANTETQLTSTYSAIITLTNTSTGGYYSGFKHGYWNIPETNVILGYQALKVEVYSYTPTSLWTLEKTFITPVLITKEIVASTLDFKLYVTVNFTSPSTMGGSSDVTSFFSFGDPTHKSGVFGLQVVTPKQSEVQLWRVNSGDYIGFEIGAYVDVIGEAFYVLLIILCGGILYFRYGHFGVIIFAFTLSGVMGGVLWVFIPAWAAAVACALILLGTTFMVWRVIR